MQERRIVRPGLLLAMVWGVVFVLTLYGPDVVQDAADKSEGLQKQAWLRSTLDGMKSVGEAIGMPKLRAGLGALREKVNAPYTVLVYEEPEAPDLPPPVRTATTSVQAPADALVHISPKSPRRILVIGASSIQFAVGVELERRLPTYEGIKVKRFGRLATGLSRPDFFNWPDKFETLASSFKPDLVIANYGGNGAQAIPNGAGKVRYKTPEWDAAYGDKVREMVQIAKKHGAEMVFMGMPIMRSAKFSAKMRYLNRVQQEAAEAAGALFIATYEMAAMPDGKSYRKSLKYRGKRGLMRTSDGVHYSKLGAKYVVEQVMRQVERHYRLRPPQADQAVAEGHAFISKVASSTISYVAYLPREAGAAVKRPALVLLPDSASEWSRWPNYPHRTLQGLAQSQGHVLIVVEAPQDGLKAPVLEELLEDVQAHLPVSEVIGLSAHQAHRALALHEATLKPARLSSISVFGGEPFQDAPPDGPRTQVRPAKGGYTAALKALVPWHVSPAEP